MLRRVVVSAVGRSMARKTAYPKKTATTLPRCKTNALYLPGTTHLNRAADAAAAARMNSLVGRDEPDRPRLPSFGLTATSRRRYHHLTRTTTTVLSQVVLPSGRTIKPTLGTQQQQFFVKDQARTMASNNRQKKNKKKKNNNAPLTNKAQKRHKQKREKEQQQDQQQRERERIAKLRRQCNLHPAAKMKRVLSAADWWFSAENLRNDLFMRQQLDLHDGYIPLTTLLTFPKFEYWTDLQLLYDAFDNPAAKRFKLIIDEKRIRHAKVKAERQRKERIEQERRAAALEKKRRKLERKRQKAIQRRYKERLQELIEAKKPELLKELNEEIEQERTEILGARRAEYAKVAYSVRGFMERQRDNSTLVPRLLDVWEKYENVEEKWELPQYLTLDDVDDEMVYESYQDELESENQDYLWGVGEDGDEEGFDNDADEPNFNDVKEHTPTTAQNGALTSFDESDFLNDQVGDNESMDIKYALVGHKRVNRSFLEDLDREDMDDDEMDYDENFDDDDDYGLYNEDEHDEEDPIQTDNKKNTPIHNTSSRSPKKSTKQLKNYKTTREVAVIKNAKTLTKFCQKLKADIAESIALNPNDPEASVVGFDVEYGTLEMDIRNTLPAMIQLVGPTQNSTVGLIWLDKFPDHGRGMLGDESVRPLLDILADASILKVGVGATKDAIHLASWWGVNDRAYVDEFIAGVADITSELDDEELSEAEGLAELCEAILQRRLPKKKQIRSAKNRKRKRQGKSAPTAHWRIDASRLTKEMKEYAASDAASGIDIWMRIKKLKQ